MVHHVGSLHCAKLWNSSRLFGSCGRGRLRRPNQQRRPISIGVSGAWGVGKSSMIRLIRKALVGRAEKDGQNFVFVEFDAWLYQGYDDARDALVDVIATKLHDVAKKRNSDRQNKGPSQARRLADYRRFP